MTRTPPQPTLPPQAVSLPPAEDDLPPPNQGPPSSDPNQDYPPSSGPRGSSTGSGPGDGPSIGPRDVRASFRASTTDAAATRQLAKMIMGPLSLLLVLIGRLIHARRTPDARYGPTPVWLPTPEQQKDIGEPLARLIARRVPAIEGSEGEISDAMDLIQAGVGAVGYAVTHLGYEDYLHQHGGNPAEATPPPRQPAAEPAPVEDTPDDLLAHLAANGSLSPFDMQLVPGVGLDG